MGGVILLMFGAGAYLIKNGLYLRGRGKRVAAAEPTAVADLEPGQGPVAITGTARAIEGVGSFPAPFTDGQALVSNTWVSESSWSARRRGKSSRNLYAGLETVPFLLADETGAVRVVPHDDAYYRVEQTTVSERDRSERTRPVQEWIDRTGAVSNEPDGSRNYIQQLIEVGETATVLAEPRETRGDWGETTVELAAGEDPSDMVFTDLDDDELRSSTTKRGLLFIGGGAVCALLAVPTFVTFLFFAFVFLLDLLL
jgi:hypothetical protein